VRAGLLIAFAALLLALPASASNSGYTADWLAQARCIHLKEGSWRANTGNGYFGGMQFSAATWLRLGGAPNPAFEHPGDPAHPFTASRREQLRRAFLLWKHDGGTWRSWGAVGAGCS
jgi:hypothetical protein